MQYTLCVYGAKPAFVMRSVLLEPVCLLYPRLVRPAPVTGVYLQQQPAAQLCQHSHMFNTLLLISGIIWSVHVCCALTAMALTGGGSALALDNTSVTAIIIVLPKMSSALSAGVHCWSQMGSYVLVHLVVHYSHQATTVDHFAFLSCLPLLSAVLLWR